MANIDDKVAQIRQAVYGKDVRENIASGIEAINTDAENAVNIANNAIPTMNQIKTDTQALKDQTQAIKDQIPVENATAEIIDARGGFDTLRHKLDSYCINVKDFGAKGDGEADDTVALQAALNASAGKATCYIPKTDSVYITKGLAISSNTHLIINGTLKLKDACNSQLLSIAAGNSNILIEGTGTLDGNGASQTTGALACIYSDSADSSNIIIKGLQIQNAKNWGINLIAKQSKILNCIIHDCSNMSFFGPGSVDVEIRGCEVFNISPDWALGFYGGVTNGILTNCIAHDCAQAGLGVLADSAQSGASHNIVIANNIAHNNGYAGIGVNGGNNDGIAICNNDVYGNGTDSEAPSTYRGGISISSANHIHIIGNIIHENYSNGIIITSTINNVDISCNTFFNQPGRGIFTTYATIDRLNIIGNSFDDDKDIPTMNNAINFQSTTTMTNVNIVDNCFGRIISGQNQIYKGALHVDNIQNNIGYNPQGFITPPAFPASGTAYTNAYGYPCNVFISGGAVTAITVNGVATGLTSGQFTLYPGQTIAITYSTAPTWKWFGL